MVRGQSIIQYNPEGNTSKEIASAWEKVKEALS